jgi:hypothetical protein
MTRLKLIGTAAFLSLLAAPPALAQHMIEEPGNYAFYHPNGDLNAGAPPSRPAQAAYASTVMRSEARVNSNVTMTKRRHRK